VRVLACAVVRAWCAGLRGGVGLRCAPAVRPLCGFYRGKVGKGTR
jgi:hypothetical protein